jgi:hypothetical protein
MKKLFTSILFLSIVLAVSAQTFFTANFSGGVGTWTLTDNSGNGAGNWQYVHNPINSASIGSLTFKSASYTNGYMMFMSDAATDDGKPEDADMISTAINCSAYSYIHMSFDEWFVQKTAATGTLYVSTNGTTWSQAYAIDYTEGSTHHTEVDLTPFAANQATVYLKFNFQGDHDFFWAIDDIKLTAVPMLDVAVDTVTVNQYVQAGANTISGRLRNPGGVTINSVDMSYTIDGGSNTSQSFGGLNIPPFGTYDFAFTTPASLDSFVKYNIAVSAFGPNGGNDGSASNDASNKDVYALSAMPSKNVMLEEFTTSVCQFCPMGGTVVETIADMYNAVIPVAIHAGFNTDAMTTADHSTINSSIGNGSAPALMIDRVYWNDAQDVAVGLTHNADWTYTQWQDKTEQRLPVRSPLAVISSNTYNTTSRELNVTVSARFFTELSGLAYRLNCYIIEDSVSGSGSGYNQINYYTNHDNGPWNPWYGKGNPIVGFKHRHVGRYLFGGAWGTASSIPASVKDGDVFTQQYSYTLPAGWNANRVKLVAFVQEYKTSTRNRTIINALEYGLNSEDSNNVSHIISAIAELKGASAFSLFPNPSTGVINIDYSLAANATLSFEVYNMLGELHHAVQAQKLNAGAYRTQINTSAFAAGVYFVAVKDDGKLVSTLKFVNHP